MAIDNATRTTLLYMLARDRIGATGIEFVELPQVGIIEARKNGAIMARIDRASLDAHDVTGPCPTCGAQR